MSLFASSPRRGRMIATSVAVAALAATSAAASMAPSAVAAGGGGGGGGGGGALVPQVIAFPSRDFVSVAEPGGTTPTTTWSHPGSPVQTSTTTLGGLSTALTLDDINHVGLPCWSSSLTAPTSNMTPGDSITVDVPGGPPSQQLAMTVSNVQTVQAKLAAGSTTTVVVTGSASDSAGNPITTPGLLEVRLVAKKSQFTFNGRRDLRAAIGGGKDGVLSYTPATTKFTATFPLLGGRNTTTALAEADARQAVASETRGLVQNDPVSPTWI